MANRGKKRDKKKAPDTKRDAHGDANASSSPRSAAPDRSKTSTGRRKLWAFRLAAAVGMPLLLFAFLELVLHVGGFGYPTGFFLEREQDGKPILIENDQFGWRFFGPKLSRSPYAVSLAAEKRSDTVRVFVFGESAAYGDPQADFGLSRMLQVMLSMRHPGRRFEVVNAAMTGINSHVVREIADDCVAADGDVWVVYMGNNEVVGPFGAGTVFGTPTPPLPMVRATIGLKTTRTGQLLERIMPAMRSATTGDANWGGMQMFLESKVHRDDPKMERVYQHLASNLQHILETARQNDIGVVVSTVAVNLKDCAPFAADAATGLSTTQRTDWENLYESAIEVQTTSTAAEAATAFERVAKLDDESADLHFRWGQSLLEMGDVSAARRELQLACDLDLLRFRCDSRMNAIIRETAAGRESERIRFVDAAERFHEQSSPRISGNELFYEHVHLTFEGNYLLARVLAEQVELLLPTANIPGLPAEAAWPTIDQCADRLAWSEETRRSSLAEMLGRLSEPPFTAQLNHLQQVQAMAARLAEIGDTNQPAALSRAVEQCRRATEAAPDDPVLFSQLALLLGRAGDLDGAYQAALKASQLLPHDAAKWMQVGLVLAIQKRDHEAMEAFQRGLAIDPDNLWIHHELAKSLLRMDRKEEAIEHLQTAVEINPSFGPGYLMMGLVYEEQGDTEKAEANFHEAVAHRVRQTSELAAVAQVCVRKGWFAEALACFVDALRLSPADPTLHLAAAECLDALQRPAEAERHYIQVIRLAPQSAQARYAFGVHFAKREQHARAAEQFEAAANINPDFLAARIDFGMALIGENRLREALAQFIEVLGRDPTNATALEYKNLIEKELGMQ